MPLPVIVGVVFGAFMAIYTSFRAVTGRNRRVMRNRDGSIYGGLVPVGIGVGIFWFLVAAGVTWLVMLPF